MTQKSGPAELKFHVFCYRLLTWTLMSFVLHWWHTKGYRFFNLKLINWLFITYYGDQLWAMKQFVFLYIFFWQVLLGHEALGRQWLRPFTFLFFMYELAMGMIEMSLVLEMIGFVLQELGLLGNLARVLKICIM